MQRRLCIRLLVPPGVNSACTAMAIPFIYSFSGNSAASAPISTFMCLWAIYIFPGSVNIFPPAEQADPSWEYIIRSQTHECGNWDWGPDIPFLGIFVSYFRHFVFANKKINQRFLFSLNLLALLPYPVRKNVLISEAITLRISPVL